MKTIKDFIVQENRKICDNVNLLKLNPANDYKLKDYYPGQFVEVFAPHNAAFLRRPISICNIVNKTTLWLLVKGIGNATKEICSLTPNESLSIISPLGKGFNIIDCHRPLLIGGGIGVAPLLYLGSTLLEKDIKPTFLFGARTASDIPLFSEFKRLGEVHIMTEDGSEGSKGLVTQHEILNEEFDFYYSCGPLPMMKAIAKIADNKSIRCQVSLENKMACGIGACLCCVENTHNGNICVCKEGPVFDINDLLW